MGEAGFLLGGISFICFLWCYFMLPESRGRTYEKLNILFQKGVPARQFKMHNLVMESRGAK